MKNKTKKMFTSLGITGIGAISVCSLASIVPTSCSVRTNWTTIDLISWQYVYKKGTVSTAIKSRNEYTVMVANEFENWLINNSINCLKNVSIDMLDANKATLKYKLSFESAAAVGSSSFGSPKHLEIKGLNVDCVYEVETDYDNLSVDVSLKVEKIALLFDGVWDQNSVADNVISIALGEITIVDFENITAQTKMIMDDVENTSDEWYESKEYFIENHDKHSLGFVGQFINIDSFELDRIYLNAVLPFDSYFGNYLEPWFNAV